MDWAFTEEQEQLAALTREICDREVTEERRRALDGTQDRFDRDLYDVLSHAGVLSGDLGLVELCRVFVELGRAVVSIPVAVVVASAVTGIADRIVAPALSDDVGAMTEANGGAVTGTKTTVIGGTIADAFVVSASNGDLYLVERDASGVTVSEQLVTSTLKEALVEFQDAAATRIGGREMSEALADRLAVATCAHQLGVCERALELTAEYAKQRVQFDRPIATFQAVGQRLADAYIDVQGIRLTLWQAAWRLAEGLDADTEIATAKFWASDAGHRVAHTAVHIHGGMGIDLDYHLHRYFTAAKRNEFLLGAATEQLVGLGRTLASQPA